MRTTKTTRIAMTRAGSRKPIGFRSTDAEATAAAALPILLPDEAHVMTIAPTGAGKTVSCTVPVLLQYPGSVIVLDPKGEQAAITARRRRELGQKTYVVDPFGVSSQPAASFNPLDFVEPETAEAADDANAVADMLLPANDDPRHAFWRSRAVHFLTAGVLHAVSDYPPGERNMVTVRDILHKMASHSHNPGLVQSGRPQPAFRSRHPEVARINDLFGLGAPETLGGMLHTALEGVGFIRGPLLEQSLARSDLSLDDLTEGVPMTIYLVLPPHLIPTHGVLLRLWLGILFGALTRRRARPRHATLLMLDETAQLGTFQPLRTALTLLRGYGVQTWSFWQQPEQLAQLYPQDWRSLIGNCRVVQCFGARSPAAWRQLADVLGVDIHAFDGLDDGAMLLQHDGKVQIADRIDYRTDPAMRNMFDPNPIHEPARGSLRRSLRGTRTIGPQPGEPSAGELIVPDLRHVCRSLEGLW